MKTIQHRHQSGFPFAWRFLVLLFTSFSAVHFLCTTLILASIVPNVATERLWPRAWVFPLFILLFAIFLVLTIWLSGRWNQIFWTRFRFFQLIAIATILPLLGFIAFKPANIVDERFIERTDGLTWIQTDAKVETLFGMSRQWTMNDHLKNPSQDDLKNLQEKIKKDVFSMSYWLSDDYVSLVIFVMDACVLACLHVPNLIGHYFPRGVRPTPLDSQ